jgi:hypothetical protein
MMHCLNGENKYSIFREIISSVIHDLKNPLSAITLGLEFIEMSDKGKNSQQAISGAITSAARIDQLLDALSMFFHDEDAPPTTVPFSHLLHRARLLVGYYFARNQIKFQIEDGGSDQSVLMNLDQAYQGMVLLLVGLAKRSVHGGEVRATVQSDPNAQSVVFLITPPEPDQTSGPPADPVPSDNLAVVCFDTARGLFRASGIELNLPDSWASPARIVLRKAIDGAIPPQMEG